MKINEIMALSLILLLGLWSISIGMSSPQLSPQDDGDCNSEQGTTCSLDGLSKSQINDQTEAETKVIKLSYSRGYYVPREITVNQGDIVRLEFDQSKFIGCMTTFNIYDLGIRVYVPDTPFIEFVADKPGIFKTGCNMGMGDGRFIVQAKDGKKLDMSSAPIPTSPPTNSCASSDGGCGCGG